MRYLFHGTQINQALIRDTLNKKSRLLPTRHSLKESENDRYGSYDLPRKLPRNFNIVELEQTNGVNTKWVVRFRYDDEVDCVVVLRRQGRDYVIVTSWLNLIGDNHKTLKRNRYNNPELIRY